jgi:hypothetical protein
MRTGFFSTDTQQDVIESLQTALEYAERAASDPQKWKWFVIALHSAAQGTMVLVLERGNGLQALTARSRDQWLKAYEARKDLPEVYLNYFMELYQDIKTDAALPYVHSEKFRAQKHHDAAMQKLNDLRNKWIHFTPKMWSIEAIYVVRTTRSVVEVLSFLLTKSQAFFWHDARSAETARFLIDSLGAKLERLETIEDAAG